MRQKRATAPWKRSDTPAAKRGRPRKQEAKTVGEAGCIWPEQEGGKRCGRHVKRGLALCNGHAEILSLPPSRECRWPGCSQAAPFRSMCPYHQKRCLGLLEGGR